MPLEPIYDKNFCVYEKVYFLNSDMSSKEYRIFKKTLLLFLKICSLYLFRAAFYTLIFVLHKDVLFHKYIITFFCY
jgi:hypothetical protein